MALDPVWFGILSTEMMFPMLRDPILANADQVASAGSFWWIPGWILGKYRSSLEEYEGIGTGDPEKWWSLCPWRC